MSIQTTDRISPEVPLQIITPELVRASIKRARKSLEDAAKEIIWQIEREAWVTLGYSSWGAMREHEYGGAAFMVPSKSRPEIVARIRAAGLTQKEIADTAGVNQATIARDLAKSDYANAYSEPVTNSRGQQRPASYNRADTHEDIIDAEIVEEDEPVNYETGEILTEKETDPATAEPATPVTCPTCHGTGKVTP